MFSLITPPLSQKQVRAVVDRKLHFSFLSLERKVKSLDSKEVCYIWMTSSAPIQSNITKCSDSSQVQSMSSHPPTVTISSSVGTDSVVTMPPLSFDDVLILLKCHLAANRNT